MNFANHRSRLRSMIAATALVAMPLAMGACVDDVGLINRTGPDKVDKTALEGVWLYVGTIVDAPYSTASAFTGQMNFGDSAKVMFDIQEKYLIAYPVVETIEGTEKNWKKRPIRKYWEPGERDQFVEMYVGPPIARWPIESHFDVKRNYNTYNGAQSNEVTENTTDRPWYQRDYIRVDWASQEIGSFFFGVGKTSGITSYLVGEQAADEPDSMVIDPDSGYLDHVVRVAVDGTGSYMCNIYGLSQYDCASAEVRVRHSFLRLDPKRDYEPMRYHNNEHQEKFGYFLTERNAYDYDWGPTYEGKVSFANRWNLWKNNFDYKKPTDDEGNELTVACMLDSDCNRDIGERCQKDTSWFDEGYCAVPVARPFSQREKNPILYWLNADWPEEYKAPAYETADEWNAVFKDAVAWKLFYEELGMGTIRSCESHADCATDNLLADVTLPVRRNGIACHVAADCGGVAGAECDESTGMCATPRSCSAADPCAVGQTCASGLCKQGGETVLQRVAANGQTGSSVIYHGQGTIVTHDNFYNNTLQALSGNSNQAFVRFIHASPDDGELSLEVGSTQIAGGTYSATRDYDPQDPETGSFMALVPAATAVDFRVMSGGSQIASVKGDLAAQSQYLVIYNGTDILVVGADFNSSRFGIRFIHAWSGGAKVDFAIQGVQQDEDVAFRQATEYRTVAGNVQRATVTLAGSRGDLTCHVDDGIGRCVGWGPDITQAHRERVATIKASLPDLFVLCENQFDELAAFDSANVSQGKEFMGDARYTYQKQDAEGVVTDYNPCGDRDLVRGDPAALKKIGDTRYSMFYWINEAMRSGPLGYGPSASDPDTGEIVYAVANIYGASLRTYSQYAADLIDLVNGDLDPEGIVTGDKIREFVQAKASEPDPDTASWYGALASADAHDHGAAERFADKNLKGLSRKAAFLRDELPASAPQLLGPRFGPHKDDFDFPELVEYARNPAKLAEDLQLQLPAANPGLYQSRFEKIQGTWIEDLMINNEVMLGAEWLDPEGELSTDQLRSKLSPATWATRFAQRAEEERTRMLMKNNLYMAEFVDDSLFGLAKELKEKGLTGDELRLALGSRILGGVLEHEVGHTVGLRHNFSGSTDVFNFHDEYYEIRERELIFCQEDTWCDDVVGEECAIQNCNADDDCPAGLFCADSTNGFKCSAPDNFQGGALLPTGVCAQPLEDKPCQSDAQCGEDEICGDRGVCFVPNSQFAPRPWMTDNEKAAKRTEYQYTTTMDYGAKINSDVQGLGKYDYAAIKFAYTGLVDTYEDTSRLRARVDAARANNPSLPYAYFSFYMNTANWPVRGTGFWHPFNYLNNYIGIEENLKRVPRPYEHVKYQRQMSVNDVREYLDLAYIEVPYAFCSDEYRGNMGCYYFDQGIDMGEMADNAKQQLEQYYIFDAFKRERLWYGNYGNPFGYYGRIMDRYLRVLGDVGMYFALWDSFLFRYSWYQEWKDMPMGGRTMARAAIDSFGDLKDIIAAPSPGCYMFDSVTSSYMNTSLNTDAEGCELTVPFGVGRYPYTQFGESLGYEYYHHPLWFGAFWEKLGAMFTLVDSTAYFADLYVGELEVGAGATLGFNTVFSEEMNNFLGGIVSSNLDFYAGREQGGTYVKPSVPGRTVCETPEDAVNGNCDVSVQPSLNSFTLRLYAAVLGLAYLPAGFDPTFIDRMAVFVEGEATQFNHDTAGVTQVKFIDPIGGKTYVAYSTNYGEFGEPKVDVGAAMVLEGQRLADLWAAAEGPEKQELAARLQKHRELIDVMRSLHHIYGTSVL